MPVIYIDADGCPVKDEVYRVALRHKLEVYVVSNSYMSVPSRDSLHFVKVDAGPDVADDWIAEHAGEKDIIITTDIPLADRCIKKGARVLGPRGREFTESSIGDTLATRDLMDHLRMMGVASGGPPPFDKKARSNFLSALHQLIEDVLR